MENELPSLTPQTHSNDLQEKYDSLHSLLIVLLAVMIIVTGAFWMLIRRQLKYTTVDLATYQAQTTNMVAQYKRSEPMADDLFKKFQEFGRTNPDFLPYLAKYGISPTTPIGQASTNRTAAAPAAVPKKK